MPAPTFIDVCAGAGGLTQGFREAGLRPLLAVERDENAAATFRANYPEVDVLLGDIAAIDLSRVPGADIVAGSLPLDAVSLKSAMNPEDSPTSAVWRGFASVVLAASASVVVVDTGRALAHTRSLETLADALDESDSWSWQTSVVRVSDFGGATTETRVLVVGSRTPMAWELAELLQTFARPAETVRDRIWTLRDVPPVDRLDVAPTRFDRDRLAGPLEAHRAGRLSERWLEYARRMQPGEGLKSGLRPEDDFRSPNIHTAFRRLAWDRPSPSLPFSGWRGLGPYPIHPDQDRRLSALESALLKGFPVDYHWSGGLLPLYRQVTSATNLDWARVVGRVAAVACDRPSRGYGSLSTSDLSQDESAGGMLFELDPEPAGIEDVAFEVGSTPSLPGRRGSPVPGPGAVCSNDRGAVHKISAPTDDTALLTVARWLEVRPDVAAEFGDAVESAVYYVLDGSRTHRFDLDDPAVDADERRTVGTKLQYYIIDNLGLEKLRHPDTRIDGNEVELKGTIGTNWTIPREGQCGVTLLVQVDVRSWRHRTRLMRTHRAWLRDGANNDGKRGVRAQALEDYSLLVYDWRDLRPNPLTRLSPDERARVFGSAGQERRLVAMFSALPGVVVPRAVVLTVCANRDDPLRRVRAIRPAMTERGRALLCGQWIEQRQLGAQLGYDLTGAAWVSVSWDDIDRHGELSVEARRDLT